MLSASDKERFARQLLLVEIGVAGQDALCAAQVRTNADADASAADVAREYLTRAGLQVAVATDGDAAAQLPVQVATGNDVASLAGDPALREAAAWLAGSWAAVETIKRVVGVGQPAELPATLRLASEER